MPLFLSHVAVKIRGLCSVYIVYSAKTAVAIQSNISVATEADRKSARPMEKSCATRTFCSQLASWDTLYLYETSEHVLQILFINCNYWKQLISTFMQLILGERNEKWTVWHSDWYKKSKDLVPHCKFWELGVMLQVSYINERLKKSTF